jgi:hydrogenase maturation protease
MRTLILGIGNLLLGDEGVGVHVVRAFQREELPENVVTTEAGTAFLDMLPDMEQADRIIIVDAMKGGEAPGTVYRIPFEACARRENIASLHEFDMARILYMLGRTTPPEVVVFGVEPETIAWGTQLSPAVQEVVPMLLAIIRNDIDGRGILPALPGNRRKECSELECRNSSSSWA